MKYIDDAADCFNTCPSIDEHSLVTQRFRIALLGLVSQAGSVMVYGTTALFYTRDRYFSKSYVSQPGIMTYANCSRILLTSSGQPYFTSAVLLIIGVTVNFVGRWGRQK